MKKLIAYMQANNLDKMKLGKRLGVSPSTVYTWITGANVPRIGVAIRLDRITRGQVSVYDWE